MLVSLCCALDLLVDSLLQRHFPRGVFPVSFSRKGVLEEDTAAYVYLNCSATSPTCSRTMSQMSTSAASRFSWRCGIPLVRKTSIVSDPSVIPALTSSLFPLRSTRQTRLIAYRRRCAARRCTAGCCHVY